MKEAWSGWCVGGGRPCFFRWSFFVATVVLFVVVPKGFLPSEDTGFLNGTSEGAEGLSFEGMIKHQQAVSAILARDANVEGFISSVGGGGGGTSNVGRMFIRLKPRNQRHMTADQVVNALRIKMAGIPGIRVFVLNPPVINIGGRFASGVYQFTLQSTDLKALYSAGPALEAKLKTNPLLRDVNSDLRISNPEVNLVIDRDRAASLGVTPQAIEDALYSAYGTRQVSTILAPNNQYYVIMELQPRVPPGPVHLAAALCPLRADGRDRPPFGAGPV